MHLLNLARWTALSFFAIFLSFSLGCTSNAGKPSSNKDKVPLCFLAGSMKEANSRPGGSFENVGSTVRLQLTAKSKEECINAGQAYCTARSNQGYVPDELGLTFENLYFVLDRNCTASKQRDH